MRTGQGVPHLGGGAIAVTGRAGEESRDDARDGVRKLGVNRLHVRRILAEAALDHLLARLRIERRRRGEHEVQDAAECVEVGARVNGVAE